MNKKTKKVNKIDMKTKFAYLLDNMFIFFILFVITYIWTKNIIIYSYITIIISAIISLSITKILFSIENEKRHKILENNLYIKDSKKLEKFMSNLSKKDQINYIFNIIKLKFKAEKTTNYIKINEKLYNNSTTQDVENTMNFPQSKSIIIPCFHYESLDRPSLFFELSKIKIKNIKIFVLASNLSNVALNFCNQNNIVVINSFILLRFLKNENFDLNFENIKINNSFKNVINKLLNKSKTKKFLVSGLFLLMGSFLLPYSLYYKIFATFLIILGVISFFIKNPNDNILVQ